MSPYATLPEAVVDAWAGLSPKAKAVAGALASFMDKGGKCWPSIAALGKGAGLGRVYSVTLALKELRDAGLVEIVRRGQHKTNLYRWSDPAQSVGSDARQTPRKTRARPRALRVPDPANSAGENTPKNTPKNTGGDGVADRAEAATPEGLRGLALYERDRTLCRRWGELLAAWEAAYPDLDVLAEVARAHAWEVANPARRKKDRPRFLAAWLGRAKPTEVDAELARREAEADAASLRYAESGIEERLAAEGKV